MQVVLFKVAYGAFMFALVAHIVCAMLPDSPRRKNAALIALLSLTGTFVFVVAATLNYLGNS